MQLSKSQRQWAVEKISEHDTPVARREWWMFARANQWPPDWNWDVWLCMAGRGWGKTRTGAEACNLWAEELGPGGRIALVARTAPDARDVMVEGESGILECSPPWFRPVYQPTRRRLVWPNGCIATTYAASEPNLLRGPQHHKGWGDEVAAWQYADAWDQLRFGMRLGQRPQIIATTTPRPRKLIRDLFADATNPDESKRSVALSIGSTFENEANLSPAFIRAIREKYEGTTIGQQELYARLLDELPGALWKRKTIEDNRVPIAPELSRIIVAVDPAVSNSEGSNETGIIAFGVTKGPDHQGYVLADKTLRGSPDAWASAAIKLYDEYKADRIVAEVNQGGDLVENTIRTLRRNISFTKVHASRGKYVRAEPVAALYEQSKIHHVGGFPELEDQQCSFTPDIDRTEESPDRVDALVWAVTQTMILPREAGVVDAAW